MTNGQRKAKGAFSGENQYLGNVARKWDGIVGPRHLSLEPFHGKLLSLLQERSGPPPKTAFKFLDMASGTGINGIILAMQGHRVIALDKSPEMIEQTKLNQKRYGVDFPVIEGDWLRMAEAIRPVLEDPFDCVINMGNSLCHLDHAGRIEALKQARGLLKAGGIFVLEYRNSEYFHKGIPIGSCYFKGGLESPNVAYQGEGLSTVFRWVPDSSEPRVLVHYRQKGRYLFSLSFHVVPLELAKAELEQAGFAAISVCSDYKDGISWGASMFELVALVP